MYYWWYPADYSGAWNAERPQAPDPDPAPPAAEAPRFEDDRLVRLAHELLNDARIRGEISLDIQNGVLILDGEVTSVRGRGLATTLAWSVPGVADVCNALSVRRRRSLFRRLVRRSRPPG